MDGISSASGLSAVDLARLVATRDVAVADATAASAVGSIAPAAEVAQQVTEMLLYRVMRLEGIQVLQLIQSALPAAGTQVDVRV